MTQTALRSCGCVVVAAGEGRRFGRPKAHVLLRGISLLDRAAALFRDLPDRVLVVRREDAGISAPQGWKVVEGGPRRRDSVARGLEALAPETEWVLVHDAARPLATRALCERVLEAARRHGCAVPVVPLQDTIKRVSGEFVQATVSRNGLFAAQTPQGFQTALLRRALAARQEDATDEAALVESLGEAVAAVPGEARNLKITGPGDLFLAEALLSGPESGEIPVS